MTIKGSTSKALATSGDLIRYLDKNGVERINKVIESDKDNVYILIKDNSAIYIDKLPRLYIMDALVRIPEISLTNELDIASFELSNILNGKSIRRNNYSYSENLNELRNNDILVKLGDNNLTNKYFKVVDKDSGKVIEKVGLGISDYRVSILDFKEYPNQEIVCTKILYTIYNNLYDTKLKTLPPTNYTSELFFLRYNHTNYLAQMTKTMDEALIRIYNWVVKKSNTNEFNQEIPAFPFTCIPFSNMNYSIPIKVTGGNPITKKELFLIYVYEGKSSHFIPLFEL